MSHTLLRKTEQIFSILICTALLTACSAGNGPEVKSKLDYLSGKHWEKSKFTVGNVQIPTKMKKIDTVIKGKFYIKEVTPLKFTNIYLLKDDKVITETITNHLGIFKLKGYMPNGRYIIKIDSKKYSWEREITVDKYEIADLEFNIN